MMNNEEGNETKTLEDLTDQEISEMMNPDRGDSCLDASFNQLRTHVGASINSQPNDELKLEAATRIRKRLLAIGDNMDITSPHRGLEVVPFTIGDIIAGQLYYETTLGGQFRGPVTFGAYTYGYINCTMASSAEAGWCGCTGGKVIVRSNRIEIRRTRRDREFRGFKDRRSVREWMMSGMCQGCQDAVFEPESREVDTPE